MRIYQFDPTAEQWPFGVGENIREVCSDPQCNDSTWEHACDLGEPLGTYYFRMRGAKVHIYPNDYIVVDEKDEPHILSPELFREFTK